MPKAKTVQLGVSIKKQSATFSVWAPFADKVFVMGSFNNWTQDIHPLAANGNEYWSATIPGVKIGHEYKFLIHNGDIVLEKNDPRALQLTAAGDASVIVDPDFDWSDDIFKMPPPNMQIVYELHIGTFNRTDPATPGTFETAMEKLTYLQDLGINVIEVLPVNGTNMERWWGYEPTAQYAVDAGYGGRKAFKEFVKAAHQHGIGVIVDVVYNHMSPENLDLWQFDGWSQDGKGGIYFYNDWRGDTPWGPRLDYGRPEVRQFIRDNVRMWLTDCHVDGVRVDAVFQIRNAKGENSNPATDLPDGWRVMQEIAQTVQETNPRAMSFAEDMAINDWITKPIKEGGAGFKAQWETSFPTKLRDVLNPINDTDRYLEPLYDAIAKRYNNDAFQRVIYSESHDADANGHARMNEEIAPGNAGNLFARRRTTLAAGIVCTTPGIPMFFQGQEFMENEWFSHWKALDWLKADQHKKIIHLYRDLIRLRLNKDDQTRGLAGQGLNLAHLGDDSKVLAYHRFDQGGPGDDVIVAINITNRQRKDYAIKFPRDGLWKVRLNSDWSGYSNDFTNTQTPDVQVKNNEGTVNLGPYSFIILSQNQD